MQRPSYPQILATTMTTSQNSTASVFQSSNSVTSIQPPTPSSTMQTPAAFSQSSAPLPSPLIAQQASSYFGSLSAATNQQQQRSQAGMASQQRKPSSAQATTYVGERGDGGGVPETAPFLNNFNLVAEAAKRAQMACLMRDLGEVEL